MVRQLSRIVAGLLLGGIAGTAAVADEARSPEVAAALERLPAADRPAVARTVDAAGANAGSLASAILQAPDNDQRAVGIPARLVGTPRWTTQRGNHTWVEVWDRQWSFVGACKPSRLNEGWFTDQASKADETKPEHRIYAASFKDALDHFPLVWRPADRDYPAQDVTRRYTRRRMVTFRLPDAHQQGEITVRHAGRIVACDRIAPDVGFELPGDSTYRGRTPGSAPGCPERPDGPADRQGRPGCLLPTALIFIAS